MTKTNLQIHPEWLSVTQTKFYGWIVSGWRIHVEPDGSYKGERVGRSLIRKNKLQRLVEEFRIWRRGYVKLSVAVDCPSCGFKTHLYTKIFLAEQTGIDTLICPNCGYERDLTTNETLFLVREFEEKKEIENNV